MTFPCSCAVAVMYRHLHSKRCSCINGYDVEASDGSRKIIMVAELSYLKG